MDAGLLLARVVFGVLMAAHGSQKLFGWFGGYGPKGTGGLFASQGYRAPVLMAVVAGLSEAGGGTLLALGFATPLACLMLATVMINAIASVTFKKAFMLGSELEIAYLTIAVSLAAIGPGRFSVDRAIGWSTWGQTSDISHCFWPGSWGPPVGCTPLSQIPAAPLSSSAVWSVTVFTTPSSSRRPYRTRMPK